MNENNLENFILGLSDSVTIQYDDDDDVSSTLTDSDMSSEGSKPDVENAVVVVEKREVSTQTEVNFDNDDKEQQLQAEFPVQFHPSDDEGEREISRLGRKITKLKAELAKDEKEFMMHRGEKQKMIDDLKQQLSQSKSVLFEALQNDKDTKDKIIEVKFQKLEKLKAKYDLTLCRISEFEGKGTTNCKEYQRSAEEMKREYEKMLGDKNFELRRVYFEHELAILRLRSKCSVSKRDQLKFLEDEEEVQKRLIEEDYEKRKRLVKQTYEQCMEGKFGSLLTFRKHHLQIEIKRLELNKVEREKYYKIHLVELSYEIKKCGKKMMLYCLMELVHRAKKD